MSNTEDQDIMGMPAGRSEQERPLAVRVEDAYKNGASDIEICRLLKITLPQFKQNYEKIDAFRKVVDLGRVYGQAWWLQQGRENLNNKNFNTPLWVFNMKNRYNWADKTENVNQEIGEESLDTLRTKLARLLPQALNQLAPELTQAEVLKLSSTDGDPN